MKSKWRGDEETPPARAAFVGVGVSLAPVLLAYLPLDISPTSAALICVLAVVTATVLAGRLSGLIASVLCFLAVNFFFSPPVGTLRVDKTEDLVALVVFLIVSVAVGGLISTVVEQRDRIERREGEARLMHFLATRLLSGEPLERVLQRFAEVLAETLSLSRCEISTNLTESPVVVERGTTTEEKGEVVTMSAHGREVGTVTVVSSPDAPGLSDRELEAIELFAGQMALAVEGMRLSSEVNRAKRDADEKQLRAALFSGVTHDLRTPLATITASVSSVLDADDDISPDARRELLTTTLREAERLNRLVANLLDLSRLRAGTLTPARVSASVDEVIEGVVARTRPLLDRHELKLVFQDDLPEISMDVVQIDQVMTNLIENAVKFSPPGAQISVFAGKWRGMVEVRVSDQGPGIAPDQRERVLDAFVRGDGAHSGTGLGLSIAKAIVRAHGGRIRIKAAPGGGACVIFDLPAENR